MLREFALEQVGPGWELYSTKRFAAGGNPELPDPLGGVCVEVIAATVTDDQTGEMTDHTLYRCLSWRGTVVLSDDEVDTAQLGGVNRAACNSAAIRLLRPLFIGRKQASLRGGDDVQAIHDAWRLAAAWAGTR